MLMLSTLNVIIKYDLLTNYCDIISSNLLIILIFQTMLLSSIILMASRRSDKILKGLQGTAATTIIVKGAFYAYPAWKAKGESSNNNNNNNPGNSKTNNKDTSNNNKSKIIPFVKSNEK